MAFDFATAKSKLRRTVHDTLAVAATYVDDSLSAPVEIKARWHNKIDRFGDPENQGYAEIIQGIDRIAIIHEDYPELTFKKGGIVAFSEDSYNASFVLDVLEPRDGVLTRWWRVVPE